MSAEGIQNTALRRMCELETLIAARRQATWQKFKSADENKSIWFRVIDLQNARIKDLERAIKRNLGVSEFKAKRGWET